MSSPPTLLGALKPWSTWGKFNQVSFVIQQLLGKVQTATLVQVKSCTNEGGVSPFGFVDVVPLVNQINGDGTAQPHTTIFNVPYLRLQGGANAVILDPQEGDIGICIFASKDISNVKSTQAQANPASARVFDYSDGLYLGGLLNGIPEQYIQFGSGGITIVSPTAITLNAPQINLQGPVTQTGGMMTSDTDVQAGSSNISLVMHKHTSESPGSPTSEPLP
jgi:hypothetical protein